MDEERVKKALLVRAQLYLTRKQLIVFRKYHEDGLELKDIADQVGITESAVSRSLKRSNLRIENGWRRK